jgi:nucleoside-diphosphate-sugar epimerase
MDRMNSDSDITMRVLIAGCGYVGLELGRQLAQAGHEVFGLRRHGDVSGTLHQLGIAPLIGDITCPETLNRLSRSYDWVVQCASATASGGGAAGYRAVYLDGVRNVIQWLAPSPPAKFIYTRSTGVYSQTDGSMVDEKSPAQPETETGQILSATEEVLLEAARSGKLPGVVLRVSGIYGPGRCWWLERFLAGEARGEGGRVLNMIHRDDVAGAIIAALEQGKAGEVYNVSDDEPVTQRDLFAWLVQATGRQMPSVEGVETRLPGNRGWSNKRISNHKLKMDLGYRLRYPTFREGFSAELPSCQNGKTA